MQSLLFLPLSLLLLGFLVPLRKEFLQQGRKLFVRLGRVAMDPELYTRGLRNPSFSPPLSAEKVSERDARAA